MFFRPMKLIGQILETDQSASLLSTAEKNTVNGVGHPVQIVVILSLLSTAVWLAEKS